MIVYTPQKTLSLFCVLIKGKTYRNYITDTVKQVNGNHVKQTTISWLKVSFRIFKYIRQFPESLLGKT